MFASGVIAIARCGLEGATASEIVTKRGEGQVVRRKAAIPCGDAGIGEVRYHPRLPPNFYGKIGVGIERKQLNS